MAPGRRRQHLGRFASAALPVIWKALERKGWSHAELARRLKKSNGETAKLLYGDVRPDLTPARQLDELLGVKLFLWDEPCPREWCPHGNAKLRRTRDRTVLDPTGSD